MLQGDELVLDNPGGVYHQSSDRRLRAVVDDIVSDRRHGRGIGKQTEQRTVSQDRVDAGEDDDGQRGHGAPWVTGPTRRSLL